MKSWQLILLQIIIIIAIIGVIVYLLRLYRALKLEKRIEKFAIEAKSVDDISFLDKLSNIFNILINKFSKILNKSVFFNKASLKYEKYITVDAREKRLPIDFISIKFLIVILFLFLSLFTLVFHYSKFNVPILLLTSLLCFYIPDIILKIKFKKKTEKIEKDLLKAVIIMNNSFQSGRNIMQAVEVVKNELDGPIQDEFKKIYLDITYGLSIDVVFSRFYDRVKIEDVKYITSSLNLLNRTGGNIVKVFSMIEKSFFDKKRLKDELQSMTASSVFLFRILIIMPLILALFIFILNPKYFLPLINVGIGRIILILIILLYVLYIMIIRKVLKVEL